MNKEEFIGKLQMVYVGDRNAFNEIVDVYDELKGDNKHLNDLLDGALKEYDRLNNIINELNEDIYHLLNVIEDNKDDIKVTSDEELAIFSCQNRLEELKEK